MITKITPNQTANQFMADYILKKYKENISAFANRIHFYPKDFRNKKTLHQSWHIYFFYYQNGKRKKFQKAEYLASEQKIAINRIKSHSEKVKHIKILKDLVVHELKTEPRFITTLLYGKEKARELYPSIFGLVVEQTDHISIKQAFNKALSIKQKQIAPVSYTGLENTAKRFLTHIKHYENDNIDLLTKKMILNFLNSNLDKISPRTFNNNRTSISTILSVLKEHDLIKENFTDSIKKLKTTPKINKAFTNTQRLEIADYLKENEPQLYAYYLHIYYGLMRPKTVIRIRVKHVNLENKTFETITKTGDFIKYIPKPLAAFYNGLELQGSNNLIFTQKGFIGTWEASEVNRRDYFTKKFLPIKKHFKLEKDYTWYSFRHTAIGNLFDNKCKELKDLKEPNYIEKALDFIRQFTNHTTNDQTKQYLRGISTEIHEDWSSYL